MTTLRPGPGSHPTYDPAASAVRVCGLHRCATDRGALHGVDLDVRHGEFVAVVGQPGSGKTTLLRALAGRDRDLPGAGTVRVPHEVTLLGPVVARTLSATTELLLGDDPFAALDPITRARMHLMLRTFYEAHRPAVVLVTHDVDEALTLAQRVVVLEAGRVRSELLVPRVSRHSEEYAAARAALVAEIEHGAVDRAATA